MIETTQSQKRRNCGQLVTGPSIVLWVSEMVGLKTTVKASWNACVWALLNMEITRKSISLCTWNRLDSKEKCFKISLLNFSIKVPWLFLDFLSFSFKYPLNEPITVLTAPGIAMFIFSVSLFGHRLILAFPRKAHHCITKYIRTFLLSNIWFIININFTACTIPCIIYSDINLIK